MSTVNQVLNPSFEYGVASCPTTFQNLSSGGVLTQSNVAAESGSFSGHLVAASANQGFAFTLGGTWANTDFFQAEVWLKGAVGGEQVDVFYSTQGGQFALFASVTLTTSFQQVTKTMTSGASWSGSFSGDTVGLCIRTSSGAATFYADACMAVANSTLPGTYFDGDIGGSWNGTPGNSTSTQGGAPTLAMSAASSSSASMGLTAPTALTLAATATSTASLAATAPTHLTLTAGETSSASLAATAPTSLTLSSTASSAASLGLTAPTKLTLTAAATSSATLAVTAPAAFTLTSSSASSATLNASAASLLSLSSSATSSATMAVSTPTVPSLSLAAVATSTASLSATAPARLALSSSATSTATLGLEPVLTLTATATSSARLVLSIPSSTSTVANVILIDYPLNRVVLTDHPLNTVILTDSLP